ncbi:MULTISPECIES: Tad domain-containing protein [Rhodobacterales]|uniref:Tad domain-containing protein n=1 Tax=Rhodobacterales TaxID=204455 RepID=UPI0015F0D0D8|nr:MULTISPECIES: Tad domain-containing protein [Rhodobacterales]MDO6589122.1 pilus assembly protein TadG-related protein [Yoonia sp. 1_MG-2023]
MTIRIQKPAQSQSSRLLRRFVNDEDGGLIVMTLILLITMLLMGGMAVDFMRFESRRAELQSVADRAVLAAAELDQELDPQLVIDDMFEKTGYGDNILSTTIGGDSVTSRSISVSTNLDIDTFYLRLAGIDTLSVPAHSGAIEGVGNVEISLVLDISGSMGFDGTDADGNTVDRIDILQPAAKSFVTAMLTDELEDRVSISLVNYSENVNIGDYIFSKLTLQQPETWYEIPDDEFLPEDERVGGVTTNPSRCVDFNDDEFETTVFDTTRAYYQVETFDYTSSNRTSTITTPRCPTERAGDFEPQIVPLSQDLTELTDAIDSLEPTLNTAIHKGMKWGVSLLDPSMRPIFDDTTGEIDPVFAGTRPLDYTASSDGISTVKYVILMTDGNNVAGTRLDPSNYDSYEERAVFTQYPLQYWMRDRNWDDIEPQVTRPRDYEDLLYTKYSATDANTLLENICDEAKAQDIIIYTIAMGATSSQMQDCASSEAHYFNTQGGELEQIFADIAEQITQLRLSL